MIVPLITSLLGIGSDLLQARNERKRAQVEAETAVIKATGEAKARIAEKAADAETSWDSIMAQNTAASWKDEFWTIVLAIPLILAFIPGMDKYVAAGFVVLDKSPDWYFYCVLSAVAAAFGIRAITRLTRK